jgi:predicted transcriptional regulator YheO
MSTVNGVSNSASFTYATQLAQTSALKRNLSNLGAAVQSGDLTSASSILAAFVKANPQYASTSTSGTQSQDPINQDFQALTDAIANNQPDAAKTAWTQITTDLTKNGITDLGNGADAMAKLLAQT